ncbi:hypothetical protein TWF225_006819 [Orbilia oligospora]|nr:hypothetical protein TWF225_006819 [Orbilia oligospora]KAF3238576.1 hypothetical protein TWF217_001693 [Orbilia oligospora]KAF3240759.1 hypothetical protein TWF128_011184 [Orbilia oligospora]
MLGLFSRPALAMARTKKDTATQGAPTPGDPEPTEAHAGEHRRASARAPTVPFQMVTRRGAQKRTSGGSEEHAVTSNDLASAGEDVYPEFAALPTPVGQGEDDPELQAGVAPSADDAGDAPRRSSRVVPKKVAPAQRSLLLVLRLSPAKLESVTPLAERLVVEAFSTKSSPPPLSPVSPVVGGSALPPVEGPAPPPRNKRPRTKKAVSPGVEEPNAEEERPKKRRKNKKSAEAAAGEEPILLENAEPEVQQPEPLPSLAPPPPLPPPMSLEPAAPVLEVEALKAEPPLDPMDVSQPEEPLQKRRGRPPKSELLKRQRQPRQPAAAPVAPAGHPVGSLAHQFREQMPEGMNMLDIVALARYMRAKDLQAKKRPMKRSIKKGYRVEHRVTREWCTQRGQKLIGQQRRIGRHVQRANVALADQAIRLAQNDPTYLSENGLGAPFYFAGLQQAAEQRDKLRDIGDLRRDLELQAVDNRIQHTRIRRRRQIRNEIVDALEKLAVERNHFSNAIRTFAAKHPDKLDEIIEECEKTGEDINIAILSAAYETHPNDIEDDEVVEKIWGSRGHGLGKWFKFVDDNRMDLDEEEEQEEQGGEKEQQAVLERDEVLTPNEGVVSHEKQQPPMSFERGGSPESVEREGSPVFDEREQPPMSNERGESPAPEERGEDLALPVDAEEFQLYDERNQLHVDLSELLEVATQELRASSRPAPKSPTTPGPDVELLNVLASAAAQREHIIGNPELLLPLSPGPSLPKEPSPAFQEGPSPAFSEDEGLVATSASPPPSFGGEGSIDERASNFSGRVVESSAEPGFALSGPAPPPEVLKPSALYQEVDHGSRFTGETRRWSDNRIFPMDRGSNFSPIGTHHHFLPGPSPPPHQSRGSSVHSLPPPPTALSSPGRLLPSPVPSTRFPAAYQALPQRSPSPGFFNPLPHDPRYRGDQSR